MQYRIILILLLNLQLGVNVIKTSAQTNFNINNVQGLTSKIVLDKIYNFQFIEVERNVLTTDIKLDDKLYLSSLNILLSEILKADKDLNNETDKKIKDLIYKTKDIKDSVRRSLLESELRLHRSILLLRYQSYFYAFLEFQKSYNLVRKLRKANLEDNLAFKKLEGIYQTVLSAIPEKYKWIGSMLALEGDKELGVEYLEQVIDQEPNSDAVLYYSLLKSFVLYDKDKALQYFDLEKFNTYPLVFQTTIAFIALKQNKALEVVKNTSVYNFHNSYGISAYLKGNLIFMLGDYNEARKVFISYFDRNRYGMYVKDALYRIALSYWFEGNDEQCRRYLDMISEYGNDITSVDRYAQNFSETFDFRDKELCESRILFDGGNFEKALEVINQLDEKKLPLKTMIEYTYRKARILDEKGDIEKATALYKNTLAIGLGSKEYYPANSALLLGEYYEFSERNIAQARYYYEYVLNIEEHQYKRELDHKASIAIERINKKAALLVK
ncbi:tetratricopeptide repeat protein [Sediminitomix flava]|uniref:Tetratricopeptide repeat protein n=1 Tax=Sediminitomix flava TaxID=379075 RepID=A0A315ZGH2_SEDFL|nr:tetratricopeptide repeat protein [Sediminitomix flava]PWJ44695.1 tetratricopeptide repeat protein [Sediminitomix flava]